jgi:hypothetical protein
MQTIELLESLFEYSKDNIINNPYVKSEKIIDPARYLQIAISLEKSPDAEILKMFKEGMAELKNSDNKQEVQKWANDNYNTFRLISPILVLMNNKVAQTTSINNLLGQFGLKIPQKHEIQQTILSTQLAAAEDFKTNLSKAIDLFDPKKTNILLNSENIKSIKEIIEPKQNGLSYGNSVLGSALNAYPVKRLEAELYLESNEINILYDKSIESINKLLSPKIPLEQQAQIIQKIRAEVGDIDVVMQNEIINKVLEQINTLLPTHNTQQLATISQHAIALQEEVIQQNKDGKKKEEEENLKQKKETEYATAAIVIAMQQNIIVDQIIEDALKVITLPFDVDILPSIDETAKFLLAMIDKQGILVDPMRIKFILDILTQVSANEKTAQWLKDLSTKIITLENNTEMNNELKTPPIDNSYLTKLANIFAIFSEYIAKMGAYFLGADTQKTDNNNITIQKDEMFSNELQPLIILIQQLNKFFDEQKIDISNTSQNWVDFITKQFKEQQQNNVIEAKA